MYNGMWILQGAGFAGEIENQCPRETSTQVSRKYIHTCSQHQCPSVSQYPLKGKGRNKLRNIHT